MCGIAGFSGNNKEIIEKMTHALVHRGPDGNAIWHGKEGSLGHCRLAILDPRPEGNQPMWNHDKTIAIVYNGEIFNFKELREQEGLACRTNTDTEVILKLYEKEGMAMVKKLRGMFAFAILDLRDNSWHLARDTGGIKPLFIAFPERELAFASEMRALMHTFSSKPELNMRSLSLFLRLQYVPGPETMCKGIEQLPPGTILHWKDGKKTLESFTVKEHVAVRNKKDAMNMLPGLMKSVVQDHLISDKPVGIFLSGGMDSSILLHHMAECATKPIDTFTVRFEATEKEGAARFNADAELAALTAKHYGTNHHELILTAEMFKNAYADTARALDQPNSDHVSVAQYLLAKEAKKYVDVVLTGAGGDELFGGYPRYRIARILSSIEAVPPSIRSGLGSMFGYPKDVLALSPGPDLAVRLLARPDKEYSSIIKGEWFEESAVTDVFHVHYKELRNLSAVRALMEFDRGLWLIDESLRLADATTMGSGLEARVPFIDPRLIAFSHATKDTWHVSHTNTKVFLKETYRHILPDHLFTLKKASFYPPLAKWLRRETGALVEELFEQEKMKELFDMKKVEELYGKHKAGEYHLHLLSNLVQLGNWMEEVYEDTEH